MNKIIECIIVIYLIISWARSLYYWKDDELYKYLEDDILDSDWFDDSDIDIEYIIENTSKNIENIELLPDIVFCNNCKHCHYIFKDDVYECQNLHFKFYDANTHYCSYGRRI